MPLALSITAPAGLTISEFVASNSTGLLDENGDASDWVELYNDGTTPANLSGWSLTDSSSSPRKWLMPAVTIEPKGFVLVFASGKDRAVAGSPLHTNFKLSADGGYLGLYQPSGTLSHHYNPYPAQYENKPYGIQQTVTTTQILAANAPLRYHAPTSASPNNATWTARTYSDGSWSVGTNGVGFESTVSGWQFKFVQASANVGGLSSAETILVTPSQQSYSETSTQPVVNFNNSGDEGRYAANINPGALATGDRDQFVVEGKGLITIPSAGTWTFGLNSDDGGRIQVGAAGGALSDVITDDSWHGPIDNLGTYNFPSAGTYQIRIVVFEGGGGASGEVFAKQGSFSSWDSGFKLVGDTTNGGLAISSTPVGANASGYLAFVGTNVKAAMLNVSPQKSSCHIRYAFTNPGGLSSLTMPIRYDDGFVAYLNGTEVSRRNAPAGTPVYNSIATNDRPPSLATTQEQIDLTPYMGSLVAGSGNVLAIHGLNKSASSGDFLIHAELAQYVVAAGTVNYYQAATPGAYNTSAIYKRVSPVVANVGRGFYTSAQTVTLSTGTAGATIRYTFDGSTPSLAGATSATYSSPITINKTTTLRYAAFKTSYDMSEVVTQTYLFPSDVIRQSPTGLAPTIANPTGAAQPNTVWPTGPVNGQILDYGMDPEVINNPAYSSTILNDLKAIPSLSIVTDLPNLFDSGTGIYVNPGGDQVQWERPASMEVIYPDGSQGVQANCGLRLRGGYSRSTDNPKHAFRLFFRDSYGPAKLNFPICGTAQNATQSFDKVDLRSAQNYSWSFNGDGGNGIFIRDKIARDMQLAMGLPSSHSIAYHLYVNGQYWGLYDTDERPDANFGESYLGGDDANFDAIKVDPDLGYNIEATDGNMDAWQQLWDLADHDPNDGTDVGLKSTNSAAANNAIYQKMLGNNPDGTPNATYPLLFDAVNTIDTMLVIYYGGNNDAQISEFLGNASPNNTFFFRDRTGAHGGFRSVLHDSEHTLLDVNKNRLGPWPAGNSAIGGGFSKSTPQYVFQQCMFAPEFQMLVADRLYRHCYNGGVLTPAVATALFDARKTEIDRAVVAESARWGDSKVGTPLTRDDNWFPAINSVRNGFFPNRTAVLISQFRAIGWYPSFDPPVINPRGGMVAPGSSVTVTAGAGTPAGSIIYYTTNGTDPRLLGGGVNPAAQTILSGNPIVINSSQVIRARTRNGSIWSALEDVSLYVTQDFSGLALTEIHYNPPGIGSTSDNFEFLELKNTGTSTLDLGGIAFTEGIAFTFPLGSKLEPGAFFVLARNSSSFQSRYGFSPNGVFTSGGLNNAGEKLTLSHNAGGVILAVTYNDTSPWPVATDGIGFTAVPRAAVYNSDNGGDWRASAAIHGSPGANDPEANIAAILINEALTNSTLPLRDTIELFNPTAASVNIGGWWLTDDPSVPQKYKIPAGTIIAADGFAVFDETLFNSAPGTSTSFAMNAAGDDVYLFSGTSAGDLTGYSHGFDFAAAEDGVSFGRYVNSLGEEQFPRQSARSFGAVNTGPLVGPLVINEVMYHPYPGYDEYIEIRNISTSPVPLYDPANPANLWKIGGYGYTFPAASSIPASGMALVVGIDPAVFRTKYAVPAGVQIFGPAIGLLQDSGERISLERPDLPTTVGGLPVVPYVMIDTVRYNDKAPWPLAADGGGPSLQRLSSSAYSDDPINWHADGATPGINNSANQLPTVSLTSPANLSNYTLPATIRFLANASDPDGSIIKVEYFINGSKIGEATQAPFTFDWAATGGILSATAKVIDNGFGFGVSAPVELYISAPAIQGLRADYFANPFLAAPVAFTRTDAQVNFDDYPGNWVNFGGVGLEQLSVRWTGQVRAPATGTFTFYGAADDGVRLWINGQQLVNAWFDHEEREYNGTIELVEGQLYPITMEMYQGWGGSAARLCWSGPGVPKQIIPQSFLYPDNTPIIITHPVAITRDVGTSATFEVFASGIGNTYQWRKNGVNISGATAPTFTQDDLWASDAGNYSVSISNAGSFLFSNAATLTVTITDTDGDGMQDSWENANGLNPANPSDASLDADGDGSSNLAESLAGTNPKNSSSVFNIAIQPNAMDDYRLKFTAQPNKSYSVQYSSDVTPASWQNLSGGQINAQRGGVPRLIEITDPSPAAHRRFYRAVTPQQVSP